MIYGTKELETKWSKLYFNGEKKHFYSQWKEAFVGTGKVFKASSKTCC